MSINLKRELSPQLTSHIGATTSEADPERKANTDEEVDNEAVKPKKRARKTKPAAHTRSKSEENEISQSKKGVWTDAEDAALSALITGNQGGNQVKASWNSIYEHFSSAYPEAGRSLNSLQMRWKTKLRAGDTDLTVEEKILFKQAVADVDGVEKCSAYAWRFKELSGRDLNKSAATKLHKMLRAGQFGAGVDDWKAK
ncbi:hypothetical protein DRE_05208 [Drechslerella stenobrocha 248]|uniref:Myb-like domain-containing protein n=1 Tax=Drechslerella stenobrocha 248 TaxID=1043628 RepID=W7HZK3_9PEZI|nr:hypothetical protein DRE_05208 [Drechslerella stenobrocha 248]